MLGPVVCRLVRLRGEQVAGETQGEQTQKHRIQMALCCTSLTVQTVPIGTLTHSLMKAQKGYISVIGH